jgi:hypothetical protein
MATMLRPQALCQKARERLAPFDEEAGDERTELDVTPEGLSEEMLILARAQARGISDLEELAEQQAELASRLEEIVKQQTDLSLAVGRRISWRHYLDLWYPLLDNTSPVTTE